MQDTPNILIKMDPERMIFFTDSEGFYEYVESVVNQEGLIEGLEEVKDVKVEPVGVEDDEIILRVWITEYEASAEDEEECEEEEEEEEELTPMTDEEYCGTGGNRCPFCGSDNFDGEEIEYDSGIAWQDVECNECGKRWQDQYSLTGYKEI